MLAATLMEKLLEEKNYFDFLQSKHEPFGFHSYECLSTHQQSWMILVFVTGLVVL